MENLKRNNDLQLGIPLTNVKSEVKYENTLFIERSQANEIFYRFLLMNNSEKVKVPRNIFLVTGCKGVGKTWLLMNFMERLEKNNEFFVYLPESTLLSESLVNIFNVSDSIRLAEEIRKSYHNSRKSVYFIIDNVSPTKTPKNDVFFQILNSFKQFKGIAFILNIQRSYFNFIPYISERYGFLRRSIFYGNREPTTQRLVSIFLDIFSEDEIKKALKKYKVKTKMRSMKEWLRYPLFLRAIYEHPEISESRDIMLESFIIQVFTAYKNRELGEKIIQKMQEILESEEKKIPLNKFREGLSQEEYLELINYSMFEVEFESRKFYVKVRENFR